MLIDDGGGITTDAEASVTYLGGEPTIHSFDGEHVEPAQRFEYRADESGIVFALVVSNLAKKSPALILTVARQTAATLNTDAKVDGVTGIAETQQPTDLGGLEDVYEVAVRSTSGLTLDTFQVSPASMRPDVFAQLVAGWRRTLDAYEGK